MDKGRQLLGRALVMDGVADIITDIEVEAVFPDGTKLVTVQHPICTECGNLELALYGSFLPVPNIDHFRKVSENEKGDESSISKSPPGVMLPFEGDDIEINKRRKKIALKVTSICDRPIQVGSHFNFIEANKYLVFDRALAYGRRLNIPAGNAVRFEPGQSRVVTLVDIGGKRIVRGGNHLCDGPATESRLPLVMKRVHSKGFGHATQVDVLEPEPCFMSRFLYAHTFGPTVGDKVRLADTDLVVEVEKDFTVYGDECKFGGGKVCRESMGTKVQVSSKEALETVIINCLIIDAVQGIIKADVGIRNGKICGIGKAGNPDTMEGVTPGMIIGAATDAITGEGLILTAGGIDTHVHFICPQLAREAVASGITTMIGGGTGPSTGSCTTTSTPNPDHIRFMIQSTDEFPLNFGFTGRGNASQSEGHCLELVEQIEAGAIGMKLHEDCGSTPAAIDTALRIADAYDVQVTIHTDTLNESTCVEGTIKAFNGRTIHTYHSEGAGGGHAPDIITVCGEPNILPSSTDATMPFTVNTVDEHMDMLMICHFLDRNLKEDIAFAESRIRAETIAAEDILHDMGAISMISSDSLAMGRMGEVIVRTWQTADKMKKQRGSLSEETGDNDNFRVKRYIAKYTINPAIAHGISHVTGSVEVGKMADLVLWNPAFFGGKPHIVIKGGQMVWAAVGNPNASIPTVEPVKMRKMFGAYGKSIETTSCIFVSKLSVESNVVQKYGIRKEIVPIHSVRNIGKKDMVLNNYLPDIKVDPETFQVYIKTKGKKDEWEHLWCDPAKTIALAQRYFMF